MRTRDQGAAYASHASVSRAQALLVMAVTHALGVLRMAKRKAIFKKLHRSKLLAPCL
jgi:hypothetical protein